MIIDIHAHCSPRPGWLSYDPVKNRYVRWITVSELVRRMRKEGIDKTVILPLPSPESSIEPVATRDAIEFCKEYGDKLIPFCNPDPRLNAGSEKSLRFIIEEYKSEGCRGVGEVTANIYFDDPRVLSLFRVCEELELPVLFHIGPNIGGCYGLVDEPGLPRLEKCLKMFPNLVFIGHSQPFWAEISGDLKPEERNSYPTGRVAPGGRVVDLFRKYQNLYGDLSAGSGYNAISRDPEFGIQFLEEFQDRLMFGTDLDMPNQDIPQLKYLRNLMEEGKISLKTYDKIMYRNATRVLKLDLE
ncbi:MAG: amidohydrolase family protein [Thaumarchaeota archaeon]|nr:amidohydrolase family protein [Nitrososphaerota archaeon]